VGNFHIGNFPTIHKGQILVSAHHNSYAMLTFLDSFILGCVPVPYGAMVLEEPRPAVLRYSITYYNKRYCRDLYKD
jgi:hypothetical protein